MAADPFFRRIAILGFGLIGASIAKAATRKWPSIEIIPIEAGGSADQAGSADLVILAAPVLTNVMLLQQLPGRISHETLVTDAGSTKRTIVAAAQQVPSIRFIGGHPMAGAARGGSANARADLFEGRPWILTPGPGSVPDSVAHLEEFVAALGAVPHVMTPELHDRFVGAVSHLPQMTATALMHVVGKLAGDAGLELAGAGLLDTTRLAGSPPDIWKDIAATNDDVLRDALDALIRTLTDMRNSLGSGDTIEEVFTSACRWREALKRTRGE
jgi:prephenate dehydrogenase